MDTWKAPVPSSFIRATRSRTSAPQPSKCAVCCTVFSFIAIIFLVWVGFYIRADTPYVELEIPADEAATQVFIAAGLYGVTFLVSIFFWGRAVWRARSGTHHQLMASGSGYLNDDSRF